MLQDKLLIPVKKFRSQAGRFNWPTKCILASARKADALPLKQLSAELKKHAGASARSVFDAAAPATVRIVRDHRIADAEGYKLTVTRDGAVIAASTDAGAFYGVQTLRELIRVSGASLPCCEIVDSPDFARRGVYHDCSRGKVPQLKTIKALIERLASWKINEFQLYIENVFTFHNHPKIGRGYSPLTPADIIEIQDHCKLHHIQFVGSLASFGHMERTLQLPAYKHLGELAGHNDWPGGTTLCPTDPDSIKLVAELYDEFIPLFEADNFNVCGDEPWELGKGRSKRRAEKIGVGQVYLDFMLKIHKLCGKHGKRMNAWADIAIKQPKLLKKWPKDIVMLHWDYWLKCDKIDGWVKQITDAGLAHMMCCGTNGWRTHGTRLHTSIVNVTRLGTVARRFNSEGLLNTNWGDRGHRNFLGPAMHSFAHGAAHSWNGRAVDNDKFTNIFSRHVYGSSDGKLAKAIRTLGASYQDSGKQYVNDASLYHTLIEPLLGKSTDKGKTQLPEDAKRSHIDGTEPAGLRKIITRLDDASIWPKAAPGMDFFDKQSLAEYAFAAVMDCAAARRALVGRDLRAGKSVSAATLRSLASEMQMISRRFSTLWLARNRQSRLIDNQKLFAKAAAESTKLAKKS